MFVLRNLTRSAFGVVIRHTEKAGVQQLCRCTYVTQSKACLSTLKDSDTDHTKLGNAEWAKKLTAEQYNITREKGTEPPFTGKYVYNNEQGIYSCVCCGTNLFSSSDKFDSGTGWPSFSDTYKPEGGEDDQGNAITRSDLSHGMVRTEVLCKQCDAHLGHVFEDGPGATGMRYCVNSAALIFKKTT